MSVNRCSIHWCRLPMYSLNVLTKTRPCVIVSNNKNNEGSGTVNVIPITSKERRIDLPVHVYLENDGTAMVENVLTIDKSDVGDYVRHLTYKEQREIEIALMIQFGVIK